MAWIEHHRTKKILEQLVVSLSALRAMLSVEGLRARCGSQGHMRCVEYIADNAYGGGLGSLVVLVLLGADFVVIVLRFALVGLRTSVRRRERSQE